MKTMPISSSLCLVVLSLGLVLSAGVSCRAETLYQRSVVQFQKRALKADPGDYSFVVLGDSRDGERVFRRALRLARSYDPLFILHGGDYSRGGGEGETDRFLQLLQENVPGIPFFVVLGNHEERPVFARRIGPCDFTVEDRRLGLTLVAVDDADDALRGPELAFLRSRLAGAAGAAFVAMHVPPRTARWRWHSFSDGADALQAILARGGVQGAFFSHVHLYDRAEFGGVPAIITGGAGAPLVRSGFPGDPVYHILVVRVQNGKASFLKVPLAE